MKKKTGRTTINEPSFIELARLLSKFGSIFSAFSWEETILNQEIWRYTKNFHREKIKSNKGMKSGEDTGVSMCISHGSSRRLNIINKIVIKNYLPKI